MDIEMTCTLSPEVLFVFNTKIWRFDMPLWAYRLDHGSAKSLTHWVGFRWDAGIERDGVVFFNGSTDAKSIYYVWHIADDTEGLAWQSEKYFWVQTDKIDLEQSEG